MRVLTADNITETAIEWLREALVAEGARKDDIGDTWVAMHDQPTPVHAIRAARQRCVDLINARPAVLARITAPVDPEVTAALLKRYFAARARVLAPAVDDDRPTPRVAKDDE